jgi:hypothetical protein
VSTVTQIQVRCTGCKRRLCDYLGEVEAGQVILELRCPRCGEPHTEIIRPGAGDPGIPRKADNQPRATRAMGARLSADHSVRAQAPTPGPWISEAAGS